MNQISYHRFNYKLNDVRVFHRMFTFSTDRLMDSLEEIQLGLHPLSNAEIVERFIVNYQMILLNPAFNHVRFEQNTYCINCMRSGEEKYVIHFHYV